MFKPKVKIQLRPYQEEALASIPEQGAFLICLFTGAGKTVIMSKIPRRGRMLILSHRDELVHQPEKYFDCSFGVEQGKEVSHGEEVISASVQSLVRRLDKFSPDDFDILIIDECHHAVSPTYQKIIEYFKPRLHLGFTATPNRFDKIGLENVYQDIIFERNIKWGIENHHLSDIYCLRVKIEIDLQEIALNLGDYSAESLGRAMNSEKINDAIVEAYCKYAKPPVLIFCSSVAHAEALAGLISGAVAVKGGEDRREIVQAFSEGKIPCITNCMVFTEGTDLPNIQTIIIARPTRSCSLYCQMVGRGTRLYPGKEKLILIDCVGSGDNVDLCTAPSLIGLSLDNVPKSKAEEIQGNLFDLPRIIEEFEDCPEAWIQNVEYVDLWEKKNDYNLHEVNYFRLPDGRLLLSEPKIIIPAEDSLGRIKWNGELKSAQRVFDEVYKELRENHSDKRALWDLSLISKWGDYPATEKQKAVIMKKIRSFLTS